MNQYQAPRGTQDVFGTDIQKWHKIEALIRELTKVFGFEEIRTPEFEHTEVFAREHDSSDVINKEMYTFMDRGQRSLSLKPEGTAGLIRAVVEHKLYTKPDHPIKYYYLSPAFRYERPQKGRMRIHHQFGIEVIGDKSPYIDAEVIGLGITLLRTLGLKDLKVLINTLGDQESRQAYQAALVDHFKAPIQSMCEDCQRRYQQNPLRILDCKVDAQHAALQTAPKLKDYLNDESKRYFDHLLTILANSGIETEVNDKLVRGLDYYTHTVFEVISVNPDMGSQATVFGGGRYDNLIQDLGGPSLSGIGFGMGIERLLVALEAEGISLHESEGIDVYCLSLDETALDYAYHLTNVLRLNGYVADYDVYGRSFKAQFKTVDRKQAKVVILLGEQEMSTGQVVMKKIDTQEQVTLGENDILHQLDHWLNEHHVCDHGGHHHE
jgi:histidyl-tRNA synthetase